MRTFSWVVIVDPGHKRVSDPHPRGRGCGRTNQAWMRSPTHVVSSPQVKALAVHSGHSCVLGPPAGFSCFSGAAWGRPPLACSLHPLCHACEFMCSRAWPRPLAPCVSSEPLFRGPCSRVQFPFLHGTSFSLTPCTFRITGFSRLLSMYFSSGCREVSTVLCLRCSCLSQPTLVTPSSALSFYRLKPP